VGTTALVELVFESYFIGIQRSATLECRLRGRAHLITPGTLGFAEPGDLYTTTRVPCPASASMLLIPPGVIAEAVGELGLGLERVGIGPTTAGRADWFRPFRRLIRSLEEGSTVLDQQVRFAECLETFLESTRRPPRIHTRRGGEPSAVRRAREHIHDRYSESITLGELSRETGLSRFHLLRTFRDAVGLPPHAYQIYLRINRARELLSSGTEPAQVAAAVGFSDQSHLGRHFKRICKVTPRVYANQTLH
jgi:AraC-like DNA-binding protein